MARFDLNNDGYIELFTADRDGPYARIYWGSAAGYNSSNATLFSVSGAGNCDAADLNYDGFADFLVPIKYSPKITIYWGDSLGPDPSNYQEINISWEGAEACFIVDCNKDGYLDLVIDRSVANNGAVLWGSASGFNFNNRTDLPITKGQHNIEVADFNKDTWLDILYNDDSPKKLYWGSASGYSPSSVTLLNTLSGPHGNSTADLNDDGFLDIVFTHWYDVQSFIYWGDSTGYSGSNMQILNPGYCYGGSEIAHMNSDDYLDIVYHRGGYGSHQQEIYWGSSTGYSDGNMDNIGVPMEATGGFVADLDFDGSQDVFCNAVTPGTSSYILWGPSFSTNTPLPVNADHHAMFREVGNVYNRLYHEDYVSSVYDAGVDTDWGIIEWDDSLPTGTNILMYVRSGNTPVPDSTWNTWDSIGNGDDISDSLHSRYIQYRARLTYDNPSYFPSLYEVRIALGPAMDIILQPDQADSTLPATPVMYDVDIINIGMGLDTVDLEYHHSTSWSIQLFDSTGLDPLIDHNSNGIVDVIINTDDTIGIVVEVDPPVGAQGGTVDSLTLVGTSNIIYTKKDSVLICTTIRTVVDIAVEPDLVEYTDPGVEVHFTQWVINRGTLPDTVDFFYTHNQPWGIALLDSTATSPLNDNNDNGMPDVIVNHMDSVGIIVAVYPPSSAQDGETDTLILIGRSSVNPAEVDNSILITIIEESGTIILFPDQNAGGQPDSWVSFNLTCRNSQSFTDTIDLRFTDQLAWTYQLLDTAGSPLIDNNGNGLVDLPGVGAAGGEVEFVTEVFIPSGTPNGTIDSILLFGYSGKDTTVQDSSILVVTAGFYAAIYIGPNQSDSAGYGDSLDYGLYVQNLGNAYDIIDLEVLTGSFAYTLRDLQGNLLTDSNNNGRVDIGSIAPLAGESILVRVNVTSAQPAYVDTAIIRAYSNNNASVYDDATLMTRVLGSITGLTLEPDQQASAETGHTVIFQLDALLEGSIADIIELSLDQIPTDWIIVLVDATGIPLTDSDSDGHIDLRSVHPFTKTRFQAHVTSPQFFGLIGQADSLASCEFYIHGWCSILESIRDSVLLQVQLVPPFDVHNFRNPFRGQTRFIFSLPKNGNATLAIYNRAGELVRRLFDNQYYTFGVHYYPWNGKNNVGEQLMPGTYIYILDFIANDGERFTAKKKAIILE